MNILIVFAFLLLAAAPAFGEELALRSIRYDEVANPGTELAFFVRADNIGTNDIERLRLKVFSHDLPELFGISRQYELLEGDTVSYGLPAYLPAHVEPGEYLITFVLTDGDDIERRYHRILYVR